MTSLSANQNLNRRDYFRIHDDVVVTYRLIAQEELPEAIKTLEQAASDGDSLTAAFAGISQKTAFLKKQIRQESPAVAYYLDTLEDKLELLARALLLRDMGVDEQDTREVSLSAGGIEFQTEQPIALRSLLEMKFVVFPSRHAIMAYGSVIRCEPVAADNPVLYKVAVEYVFIRETDRQLIIKHVLGKQSSQLRQQRALGSQSKEKD